MRSIIVLGLIFLVGCGASGGGSQEAAFVAEPPKKTLEPNQRIKLAEYGDWTLYGYTNLMSENEARFFCSSQTEFRMPDYVSQWPDFNIWANAIELRDDLDETNWWVLTNVFDPQYSTGELQTTSSIGSNITGAEFQIIRDAKYRFYRMIQDGVGIATISADKVTNRYGKTVRKVEDKLGRDKAYVLCEVKEVKLVDVARIFPGLNFCEHRTDWPCEKIAPKITVEYVKPFSYRDYAKFEVKFNEKVKGSSFKCSVDSVDQNCGSITAETYSTDTVYIFGLTGGRHVLKLEIEDLNGNVGTTTIDFEMPARLETITRTGYKFVKDNATGEKLTEIFAEETHEAQRTRCQNLYLDGSSWRLPYRSELTDFGGVGAERVYQEIADVWTADTKTMSGTVSGQYASSTLYAGVYNLFTGFFNSYVQTTPTYGTTYPKRYAVCFATN